MSGEKIERVELAPGLSVSRVLTGLWQVADIERRSGELELSTAAAAMRPYVDAGLTTFDVADHYGSAEQVVGEYRRTNAERSVEALTKWVPKPGPLTRGDVSRAVDLAAERLGADTLELLQFHAWNYADPSYLDGLFFLDELRRDGRIRNIGLTNCDAVHLEMLLSSGFEIVSNQVCFSLIDRRAAGAMTALCVEKGVSLLAYGTLAGGLLTQRFLDVAEPDVAELETWSLMKYRRFVEAAGGWSRFQGLLRDLAEIAARLEISLANLATRYVLEQPAVAGVIVGARLGESEHVAETARLFSLELGQTVVDEIDELLARLDPIPGDCGDEYRREPFLTASGDLSHHFDEFPAPYRVEVGSDGRRRAFSGVPWESMAGYCRAIREGRWIRVSGTTASHRDRLIGGDDPASQTHFVIDKIEGALQSLGGRLEDVVRTRVYVPRIEQWEAVARAHGQRFRHVLPVNTMVQAALIGDEFLVEIEAEAVVDE
ncbi:MAG: aldo/keto reductase [Acidobacteria bacterium]|nr:aldo/keto reductase [Acidobacteriota bacterium]